MSSHFSGGAALVWDSRALFAVGAACLRLGTTRRSSLHLERRGRRLCHPARRRRFAAEKWDAKLHPDEFLAEWAVMNNANVLPHSNQNAKPQIIVPTRAYRRNRDSLDDRHPYDSMRRYAELLALKYQKMKESEP